jgi:hypothetical protein
MLDIIQFLESLKSTDISFFILAVIVIVIANASAALRWAVLMKQANAKKSQLFMNAFGIFSLGQVTGFIVPTRIGSYAKTPLVMKLDNLTYKTALSAVNAETILDLAYISCAGIVSIFILSVFFSTQSFLSTVLICFIGIILIVVLIVLYKIHYFEQTYEKLVATSTKADRHILVKIPSVLLGKLYELITSTRKIFTQKGIVVKLSFFTLVAQFLGVIGFLLVIKSAHETLPLIVVFAILMISYLIGIISLIPGGLGASDLSMIVLLESTGITLPVATNIAVLWRFATFLPILAISGLYSVKIQVSHEN